MGPKWWRCSFEWKLLWSLVVKVVGGVESGVALAAQERCSADEETTTTKNKPKGSLPADGGARRGPEARIWIMAESGRNLPGGGGGGSIAPTTATDRPQQKLSRQQQ